MTRASSHASLSILATTSIHMNLKLNFHADNVQSSQYALDLCKF